MRGRGILVLAILAALLGAPSSVFAARNSLSAPSVTPATGTTATTYTFRISYDGFPAIGVRVAVAGRSIGLSLVSGSTSHGAWSASARLPAGTWSTSFGAEVERGNAPILAGPQIIVRAVATATPTAATPSVGTTTPPSAPDPGTKPGGADPGDIPAPAPTFKAEPVEASPAPTEPVGAPAEASARPSEGDAPVVLGTPGAGPVATSAAGSESGPSTGAGHGTSSPNQGLVQDAPDPSRNAMPAAPTAPPEPDDHDARLPSRPDEPISLALAAGLCGIAAVALIGVALLLLGRRRAEHDDDPIVTATDAGEASARLKRRALRRARLQIEDDPIVAALGIGDDEAARRARRRASKRTR